MFLSTWVCILHNTCTLYNSINALCSLQDAFTLQRKKSLPDVTDLVGVVAQQSSQEMTREEISVLSSARRDNVRRQMDEIERYKSNPVMYILNPRVQVREQQQQQQEQQQQQQQEHSSPLLAVTASCVAHLLLLGQPTLVVDDDDDEADEVVAQCDEPRQFDDFEVD